MGLTGATVTTGVTLSDQLPRTPAPVWVLISCSVQTPGTQSAGSSGFGMSTVLPSKAASALMGRYEPVKGALPEVIGVAEPSSRMVLTNVLPLPPTPVNKGTCVPSGAIKTALSPESAGTEALIRR